MFRDLISERRASFIPKSRSSANATNDGWDQCQQSDWTLEWIISPPTMPSESLLANLRHENCLNLTGL